MSRLFTATLLLIAFVPCSVLRSLRMTHLIDEQEVAAQIRPRHQ